MAGGHFEIRKSISFLYNPSSNASLFRFHRESKDMEIPRLTPCTGLLSEDQGINIPEEDIKRFRE